MWAELEESAALPQPATWIDTLRSAVSGLIICVLILAAFAVA